MVINILGTRGLFRVRREFSVLAERHIFGRQPKPRAAELKPETALEKSLAPRVGDLPHVQSLHARLVHSKYILSFPIITVSYTKNGRLDPYLIIFVLTTVLAAFHTRMEVFR